MSKKSCPFLYSDSLYNNTNKTSWTYSINPETKPFDLYSIIRLDLSIGITWSLANCPSDWTFGYRISGVFTVCPGSSDPFNIIGYYIKWVTTSWTYSIIIVCKLGNYNV